MDEIRLLCEGVVQGRDLRWFTLAFAEIAETFEPASQVRVIPGGSKADLAATVRGLREALKTPHVYAIRDRDFVPSALLGKDIPVGVYSLRRHCLESYLLEPELLENAFKLSGLASQLNELADNRFWPDLARAVLDAIGYQLRQDRLRLGDEMPKNLLEVTEIVQSKVSSFGNDFITKPFDVRALVESFALDLQSDPSWMRVNGKELLKTFASQLDSTILPGGDIEAKLFRWCAENGLPRPFVDEVRSILMRIVDSAQQKNQMAS